MSGIGWSVRRVLEAYTKRMRTNNPKTNTLLQRKKELRRYGKEGQLVLVKAFVRAAAEHFGKGELREARRFYDGAFAFGTKDQIRGHLLGTCAAIASKAFRQGDHETVWLLLAAARYYCPEPLDPTFVDGCFAKYGVVLCELRAPDEVEPLRRLHSVGHLLPTAAVA